MTTTDMTAAEASDTTRNGVDTATLPSWWARTTGRFRPSSCCTRWLLASPLAWPTSLPPGGSGSPRFAPRSPAEKLREIVEQSLARSAVYDVITNGVPVAIEVDTL